jgi:hypothetical protein
MSRDDGDGDGQCTPVNKEKNNLKTEEVWNERYPDGVHILFGGRAEICPQPTFRRSSLANGPRSAHKQAKNPRPYSLGANQ